MRQAIVWAGFADPGETREELQKSSDVEAAALRSLIEGWPEIDPYGAGLTSNKILDVLGKSPDQFELVRSAIFELCPCTPGKLPGVRSLGNKLRHLRGRVVGGKAIDKLDQHGTALWKIADVGSESKGPETGGSTHHPNGVQGGIEDKGCSGCSGCSTSHSCRNSSGVGADAFKIRIESGAEQLEQPEHPVTYEPWRDW